MIPSFRTVADAAVYAEQHQPMRKAMAGNVDPAYAVRYGRLAYDAARRCHNAARNGDMHSLHLGALALSLSVNPPLPRTH